MGYTHYWYYNPSNASSDQASAFARAVAKIKIYKSALTAKGVAVKGSDGTGVSIMQPEVVSFNGDENLGLGHETFRVESGVQADRKGFNFCKTARKPYDILVCLSLISFFEEFSDARVFSYCSDGDESDWQEAYDLYQEINGRTAPTLDEASPPEA